MRAQKWYILLVPIGLCFVFNISGLISEADCEKYIYLKTENKFCFDLSFFYLKFKDFLNNNWFPHTSIVHLGEKTVHLYRKE